MSNHLSLSYDNAGVSVEDMQAEADRIKAYISQINTVVETGDYGSDEASLVLPADEDLLTTVGAAVDSMISEDLRWIVVVGIGGSNLGTMAVYEALLGKEYNMLAAASPKIFFLDTNSPKRFDLLRRIIDEEIESPEQIVVNAISKSGGTTETIAGTQKLFEIMTDRFGKEAKSRFVLTTGKDSKFWNLGKKLGMFLLPVPDKVGGRYSVLSAVGLFPLMLSGIYIEDLVAGARSVRDRSLSNDVNDNPALASATVAYLHYKQGKGVNNSFFFNAEMESVGKWYRQLMGESVGKQFDLDGNEVREGITPIVSIGSIDLHSMAQLYFGGPKSILATLVYAKQDGMDTTITDDPTFNLVDGIAGKDFTQIMVAIHGGVKKAYDKNGLPYMEVSLDGVTAFTIGEYLQFKMLEMMYLARLMNVNAFDQANVEDYKIETKKLLEA